HYYQGGDGSARPYDRPDGFGCETSAGPIVIEDTTAEHNYGDGLDSKASNTTIRRCVVANNSCDGVKLWGGGSRVESTLIYGRGDGDATPAPWAAIVIDTTESGASFELVNVTVDDALGQNYLVYVQYDDATSIGLTIRNSIFRATGQDCPIWLRDTVSLAADHNLFYLPLNTTILTHGNTDYTAATISGLGAGNASADPLFVAPAWGSDGNYHLQSGSPAIDAGTATGAPVDDLDGVPRDATPDLGAYEYAAGSQCTLTCQATPPTSATAGSPAVFSASATATGCGETPSFAWAFGDGGQSAQQSPSHTYAAAGSYQWSLTVSAGTATCTGSGTITVAPEGAARPPHSGGQVVPQVAHLKGKGVSYWTTDLTLANPTAAPITTKLYFTVREADGLTGYAEAEVTVPAGACRTYSDVVLSLFGLSGAGSLEVVSADLIVATRTFTAAAGGGSYGQGCPPVAQDAAISTSDGLRLLTGGVIAGSGARSNLALNEVWGEAAGVRIRLLDRDGTMLGERTYQLQPYGNLQVNDLAHEVGGLTTLAEGQVEVTVTQGTGRVAATLFLVDGSDDPATVPLVVR
ncbi:MAG: PKD domain-containing protein, partial [Acidobacteria bacterium]|nr:PKD domain-containing protein [Acidobacteriota bacterium]